MRIIRAARITLVRATVLTGLAAVIISCDPAKAGGPKMAAATTYQWKDLWRGSGPPKSPTGTPPGLTIVHSKEAWTRIMTAFGPLGEKRVNLEVDWGKDLILFVQANEDNPDTKVHLKSISSDGKTVTISAVLRNEPDAGISYEVMVRPWVIASVPAAAFAGNPVVKFSIDGRDLPVVHEK